MTDSGFQQTSPLISNLFIGHIDGAVSFLDRILLSASLPVTLAETGPAGHGASIGDPRIGALARIWGQPLGSVVSISAGANLWIPLRAGARCLPATSSDQQVRVLPKVVVGGLWRRLLWSATAGVLIRQEAVLNGLAVGNADVARVGSELQLGLAASYFDAERRFSFGPEFADLDDGERRDGGHALRHQLEALFGGQYNIARMIQVGLGGRRGFVRQPGTPDARALCASLTHRLVSRRSPRSKTPTAMASRIAGRLPARAWLRTGDAFTHGCRRRPRWWCSTAIATASPTAKTCAPTYRRVRGRMPKARLPPRTPPPDRDGDGIIDREDQCPDVPQGPQADAARKGCPAQDSDKDGVVDALDQCLFEPAGLFPDPNAPGCPLSDKDGDQVPDVQDACPKKPARLHPDPKRNGCPSLVEVKGGRSSSCGRCSLAPMPTTS